MACKGCTCSTSASKTAAGDKVAGCGSNGCSTGGCNRMNTYDWLTALEIEDTHHYEYVEVSFKNGSRKEFFKNPAHTRSSTGDMILVETDNGGYDVGRVSLSGELVRLQMKKRNVKEKTVLQSVIRKANERDLERLQEAREAERPTMVLARAISSSLKLDMKIGDVEYQGDKRKATFYYTADGRVDFRELIREFAREFKVKIEMRQIGARQESARIGGLGPCGRELCCSTWLTDFKSVSTLAARYQNLAINQSKLSGQCGRLKCCLNFELDSYMDALEAFPNDVDRIETEEGAAVLMKTDIFKGLMFYCYEKDRGRGRFYPLEIEQVKEIKEANKVGMKPQDLSSVQAIEEEEDEVGFDGDLTGVVELPNEKKKKKKRKKSKREDDGPNTLSFRRKEGGESNRPPQNNNKQGNRDNNRKDENRREDNRNRPPQQQGQAQGQERKPQQPGNKEPRENRNNNSNINREPRENRPQRENREPREPRENREGGDNRNRNQQQQQQKPQQNRPPRPEQKGSEGQVPAADASKNTANVEGANNQQRPNNKNKFRHNKNRNNNADNKPPANDKGGGE
jgi:cell fate regulator YaaT (PSP1 superfamily)